METLSCANIAILTIIWNTRTASANCWLERTCPYQSGHICYLTKCFWVECNGLVFVLFGTWEFNRKSQFYVPYVITHRLLSTSQFDWNTSLVGNCTLFLCRFLFKDQSLFFCFRLVGWRSTKHFSLTLDREVKRLWPSLSTDTLHPIPLPWTGSFNWDDLNPPCLTTLTSQP